MVPPEACGGGEAFGGEQDAPPRYGKSVSAIASVREGGRKLMEILAAIWVFARR